MKKTLLSILSLLLMITMISTMFVACGDKDDNGGDGGGGGSNTQYTITVQNGTGGGKYAKDADVTVSATVPEGKYFKEWQDATGEKVSGNNPYTFKASANVTLVAVFGDLTLVDGNIYGATVYGNKTPGNTVYLIPNETGLTFTGWTVDGQAVQNAGFVYAFAYDANKKVQANYVDRPDMETDVAMFSPEAPSGQYTHMALDRLVSGTGSFGDPIEFVLVFVYVQDETEPIAMFKYHSTTISSIDGSYTFTLPTSGGSATGGDYGWSTPGNYYIFEPEFIPVMQNILGSSYSSTTRYYFKNQILAQRNASMSNSTISALTTNYFQG